MTSHKTPRENVHAHGGKVENDTNKVGDKHATQLNQGKRTPDSRSDRESHIGSHNQSQSRRSTGQ